MTTDKSTLLEFTLPTDIMLPAANFHVVSS
jgi:hypothetical protein